MLEKINSVIGAAISRLCLAMVVVTFAIVVFRYLFNTGWIYLQESVVYMYALIFLLGAAYTLQQNGHVRVDIFYQRFTSKTRAWVDLFGSLFLLIPVCLFILISSWDYAWDAWQLREGSREAGGLPAIFLLKMTLLIMPLLLILQASIICIRCSRLLLNRGAHNA
ncbi:MAG: TRAP transporter small permease subunit [Gammaproteobacteria bacterium]|nr:TRAP transporter small permease subunit [Gammaproteobacteria bacterium]MDH5731272.1 TRAP transporter small permease subunit [Gammaproteobacteria bacterium]